MGLLAQKSGDLEHAIAEYSHAMSVEPTAVGYVLLARALEQVGHQDEAKAALDKARPLTNDLDQAQQTADELLAF
jgi:Flp pilus assembly protein TadD